MKNRNATPLYLLVILVTLGWLLPEWGPAQDEKATEKASKLADDLMIQVELIKLDHTVMTKLLFKRPMKSDATALREEIAKLIEEGKAEIAETGIVITKSATRARIESIREHIYPTQYHPPSGLQRNELGTPAKKEEEASNKADNNNKAAPAGEEKAKDPKEPLSEYWPPQFFPSPTAFETRNVGLTVEVDPLVRQNSEFIDLTFSVEFVSHEGEDAMQTVETPQGKKIDTIKMPAFYTARLQVARRVKNGAYTFMGAATPVGKDGKSDPTKKYLIFTRVSRMESE